jgi:hypothetical protein
MVRQAIQDYKHTADCKNDHLPERAEFSPSPKDIIPDMPLRSTF